MTAAEPGLLGAFRGSIQHRPVSGLRAALARLEGRGALEEILARFPDWDVDWENARLAQASTVRGREALPVVIG